MLVLYIIKISTLHQDAGKLTLMAVGKFTLALAGEFTMLKRLLCVGDVHEAADVYTVLARTL